MKEFDLIARIRERANTTRSDVVLGIGDDAALLQAPVGGQLVVTMDTLNAGVHFADDAAPADIGWKALAVNLSDLAAMGAQPAWCTLSLSLSLPKPDADWMDAFIDGFLALARQHAVALVGGDTTSGPLSVCVTAHGFVAADSALRRDRAQDGDDIWVSGTLGDAAGALVLRPAPGAEDLSAGHGAVQRDAAVQALRTRLDRPEPRIEAGIALVGIAHACIDLSDGLFADLGHVCEASGLGAELSIDALPASDALQASFDIDTRRALQAGGGDDYELCFTAAAQSRDAVAAIARRTGTRMTRIGRMVSSSEVRALDADGQPWLPSRTGYRHFERT